MLMKTAIKILFVIGCTSEKKHYKKKIVTVKHMASLKIVEYCVAKYP